jgi:hypothetical protein
VGQTTFASGVAGSTSIANSEAGGLAERLVSLTASPFAFAVLTSFEPRTARLSSSRSPLAASPLTGFARSRRSRPPRGLPRAARRSRERGDLNQRKTFRDARSGSRLRRSPSRVRSAHPRFRCASGAATSRPQIRALAGASAPLVHSRSLTEVRSRRWTRGGPASERSERGGPREVTSRTK